VGGVEGGRVGGMGCCRVLDKAGEVVHDLPKDWEDWLGVVETVGDWLGVGEMLEQDLKVKDEAHILLHGELPW